MARVDVRMSKKSYTFKQAPKTSHNNLLTLSQVKLRSRSKNTNSWSLPFCISKTMSHWTDHRKDSNVTAMYVHIQWTTVINSTRNRTWNNWRCGAMSVRVPVCMLVRCCWCPRWSQVGPSVRGLDKRWGAMVTFKLATLALSPTLLGPFVTWSDLAETSSTTHQIEILRTAHGWKEKGAPERFKRSTKTTQRLLDSLPLLWMKVVQGNRWCADSTSVLWSEMLLETQFVDRKLCAPDAHGPIHLWALWAAFCIDSFLRQKFKITAKTLFSFYAF